MIWTKSKINHAFVFEYDSRHTLEWRQLLEVRFPRSISLALDIDISTDSLLLPLPDGPFHVAQFLMVQSHVYLLARRPDRLNGHHYIPASSSVTPQES